MNKTFEQVFEDASRFSINAFPNANAYASMNKLIEEAEEVKIELNEFSQNRKTALLNEYADCFLCLTHSVVKAGYTLQEIIEAMDYKNKINKGRTWKLNSNNTYSHQGKDEQETGDNYY